MEEQTVTRIETNEVAGKYLTFALADEEYGLEILKVREIISMCDVTAIPKTPEYVKGVINLRGKVIPIIDLRLKFGLSEAERTEETCIIVVNVSEMDMGVIVDKVLEVLDIAAADIEEAPAFGGSVDTTFILGMAKAEGQVTTLLEIEKAMGASDIAEVAGLARGGSGRGGE
ncbi:MAG: chemotaxis protein CheW [Planctomycetota bacterium]|jgi:purine-binding chemotaxis protein CheW